MILLVGSYGITSNFNVELHAISYVMLLAWNMGYWDIICESISDDSYSY